EAGAAGSGSRAFARDENCRAAKGANAFLAKLSARARYLGARSDKQLAMSNSASISRPTPVADYSATLQNIRRLIYLYLFLLIIEGALRKWIVPQFSNPLLLVRDPVVLMIYLLAWRAHIFPRNAFISSLATIGILSWIVSFFLLHPPVPMTTVVLVSSYHLLSN